MVIYFQTHSEVIFSVLFREERLTLLTLRLKAIHASCCYYYHHLDDLLHSYITPHTREGWHIHSLHLSTTTEFLVPLVHQLNLWKFSQLINSINIAEVLEYLLQGRPPIGLPIKPLSSLLLTPSFLPNSH